MKWLISIPVVALLVIALLLPFLLSWVAGKGFQAGQEYSLSDLLSYYGSVLVFIGTSSLAVISLIQNKRNQEKTNRINELTLELQKKTMQFAEYQYNKDKAKEEKYPEFEVKILSHHGDLTGCKLELRNISDIVADNLKPIDLSVIDPGAFRKKEATELRFEKQALNTNESTRLLTTMALHDIPENCYIELNFACEVETGQTYYYGGYITIPDKGAKLVTEKMKRRG